MSMEFSSLKDFQKRLDKLKTEMPQICKDTINDAAAAFDSLVTDKTPVDTGYLKAGWSVETAEGSGRSYTATVFNSVKYGLYVEKGHRQKVGQYVPKLGKSLSKPFVPGKHFVEQTVHAFRAGGVFEKKRDKAMKRIEEVLGIG